MAVTSAVPALRLVERAAARLEQTAG